MLALVLLGVGPESPEVSQFELKRRAKADNKFAQLNYDRVKFQQDLLSIRLASTITTIICIATILFILYGWLNGFLLSLLLLIILINLSRLKIANTVANSLYRRVEVRLVLFIKNNPNIVRLFRLNLPDNRDRPINSLDELSYLISQAKSILTAEEKSLIKNALALNDQAISSTMVVRDKIPTIKHSEVLGPLVLNDLHKTGERLFLVIDSDLDHVLGTIDISDQLIVDGQSETKRAGDIMSKNIIKVDVKSSVKRVLLELIDSQVQLAIVMDGKKTKGIVYLRDLVYQLFGRD